MTDEQRKAYLYNSALTENAQLQHYLDRLAPFIRDAVAEADFGRDSKGVSELLEMMIGLFERDLAKGNESLHEGLAEVDHE